MESGWYWKVWQSFAVFLPVKSVGEALESAGAKYFKDAELWVKTKMPVAVMLTDNVLPKDEFKIEKVDRRRKDEAED